MKTPHLVFDLLLRKMDLIGQLQKHDYKNSSLVPLKSGYHHLGIGRPSGLSDPLYNLPLITNSSVLLTCHWVFHLLYLLCSICNISMFFGKTTQNHFAYRPMIDWLFGTSIIISIHGSWGQKWSLVICKTHVEIKISTLGKIEVKNSILGKIEVKLR